MHRSLAIQTVGLFLAGAATAEPVVVDLATDTHFIDLFGGTYKRGRCLLAADFNLDDYVDFYSGNPGDESFVMLNDLEGSGLFTALPPLHTGERSWGGCVADFDNDGDYDIFITNGGNEGRALDMLYRNDLNPATGEITFVDVTNAAGVAGPDLGNGPIPTASANATAVDYNNDGLMDIWVNVNIVDGEVGRNILWRNNGFPAPFTDVTDASGLGASENPTRHSSWLDFDNDGDMDLYENNHLAQNILWENRLNEGPPWFVDVTMANSLDDYGLRYPHNSFTSAVADINNDGWEDLVVFARGTSPFHDDGHVVFINQHGTTTPGGFTNESETFDLNDPFEDDNGVMGAMVGDVNGDGMPDVYIGNGGPPTGQVDNFYLSNVDGMYDAQHDLIDFAADDPTGATEYPYRTHGTCFVDVDQDGDSEIAVCNGGPADSSDVEEPNRLFDLTVDAFSWLNVRLRGDGGAVARDAIGTRVRATATNGVDTWTVYQRLYGGNGFSAQNGFELHFGLGDAVEVTELVVTWVDSTETVFTSLAPNQEIVVSYGPPVVSRSLVVRTELAAHPNPFNPRTRLSFALATQHTASLVIYDVGGRIVRRVVNSKPLGPGTHEFVWAGDDDGGRAVASGVYFATLTLDGRRVSGGRLGVVR